MNKTLFTHEAINSLFVELNKIEAVRYIAIDQGQMDQMMGEMNHPPIMCPGLLVALVEEYTEATKDASLANAKMDVRLFVDHSKVANIKGAPLEETLSQFGLIDRIVDAVDVANISAVYDGFNRGMQLGTMCELTLHFTLRGGVAVVK